MKEKPLTPRQTVMANRLKRDLGVGDGLAARIVRVLWKVESERIQVILRRKAREVKTAA